MSIMVKTKETTFKNSLKQKSQATTFIKSSTEIPDG